MPSTVPDSRSDNRRPLHVAVGVIADQSGRVLIARRPQHVHQGGLWEFPGGKVEAGESVVEALHRELDEELGVRMLHARPLIKIKHCYPDRVVLLDVWRIDDFAGQAWGREGQDVRWVDPAELIEYDFPEANRPIISAAVLPPLYGVLEGRGRTQVMANLKRMLDHGVKLIQIRLKTFTPVVTESLMQRIAAQCREFRAQILLNSALSCHAAEIGQGVHLTARDLLSLQQRPKDCQWVAASCHNLQELQRAEHLGVDFVVLAPVLQTRSHPQTTPLGWQRFSALAGQAKLPVYALGGLNLSDLDRARRAGAQGIAGISTFQ